MGKTAYRLAIRYCIADTPCNPSLGKPSTTDTLHATPLLKPCRGAKEFLPHNLGPRVTVQIPQPKGKYPFWLPVTRMVVFRPLLSLVKERTSSVRQGANCSIAGTNVHCARDGRECCAARSSAGERAVIWYRAQFSRSELSEHGAMPPAFSPEDCPSTRRIPRMPNNDDRSWD